MPNPTSGQLSARDIFMAARAITDGTERDAFLQSQCGQDQQLRKIVSGMLAAPHAAANPLDLFANAFSPAQTLDDTIIADPIQIDVASHPMIGPYKLLEQIGEGGMGTVFMAVQSQPIKRKVALKIIKPGMDTGQVVARFEAERQALALMNHPNIAKVLDAGATETGRPYFVMELVRGIPITEFCNVHQLDLRQRLEMLCTVCQAVQHAHQKGVIHRDLKPSNILVEMQDVTSVPKVIDFGVAKSINQPLTERTLHTGFAQMVGTPLYMSPEQTQLSSLDVDTRSDVYSLGVLLYEMLTGSTPFDKDTLRQAGFDEMRRIIREDEPVKPSERISTLAVASLSTISEQRKVDPRKLSTSIRGELDWIVMKALEKDRNRRYESASAFAQDIQRFLKDEPVHACPPEFGYRLRKAVRRNQGKILSLGGLSALLITICVVVLIARFATQKRNEDLVRSIDNAAQNAEVAVTARDLSLAELSLREGRVLLLTASQPLHEQTERLDAIESEINGQRSEAIVFNTFIQKAEEAQGLMTYGDGRDAVALAKEALALYDVLTEKDWIERLKSRHCSPEQSEQIKACAYETLLCLADFGPRWRHPEVTCEESLELLNRAAEIRSPTKGWYWVQSECFKHLRDDKAQQSAQHEYESRPAVIALDHYLPGHTAGWKGDRDGARRAYLAALQLQPSHFNSMIFMAMRLASDQRFDAAIAYYSGCIGLRPHYVAALVGRGKALNEIGDDAAAERDFLSAISSADPVDHFYALNKLLEFYRRTRQHEKHVEALVRLKVEGNRVAAEQTAKTGPDDPQTLAELYWLVAALNDAGAVDEGIAILEPTFARHRRLLGVENETTLTLMQSLGWRLAHSSRAADAVPLLEEALGLSRRMRGEDDKDTVTIRGNLGTAYMNMGHPERGVTLLEETLAKPEHTMNTRDRLAARNNLGMAYTDARMWDKAVPFLKDTLAMYVKEYGADHAETLTVMDNLAFAYCRNGQADLAIPILQDALEKHRQVSGPNADRTLTAMNALGFAFTEANRPREAIPVLIPALDSHRRQFGEDHQDTLTVTKNLGAAYLGADQFADAVALYEKLLETHTRLHGASDPQTLEVGGALLEAYRRAGNSEDGKRLALSRLKTLRTQADEIQLSSGLANTADMFLTFELFAEAEPLARECVQIRAVKMPDTWLHFNAQSLLGGALLGQAKYEEAEPLLLQAFEGLDLHRSEIPPNAQRHITATIDRLIRLYESTNRPDDAALWKAKLPTDPDASPISQ